MAFPRRGEITWIALDPTVGTEIKKKRPCLVVSNDIANEKSPQITVVPVTAYDSRKAKIPVCVAVQKGEGGLKKRSVIVCSQIRAVDKRRVRGRALGSLTSEVMKRVDKAIKIHLSLSF